MSHLQQGENKTIAGMIDRLTADKITLNKILDANDKRLDKAEGREWNELQGRVARLQTAFDNVTDAIKSLMQI